MARDFSLPLREAIITHLKADGARPAAVPADSVYGMRQPQQVTWPFTRYGAPDATPRAWGGEACGDGADIAVALHAFSKAAYEDECCEMVDWLISSLDGVVLTVDGNRKGHIRATGSTVMSDGAEANAWHGIARFEATIA